MESLILHKQVRVVLERLDPAYVSQFIKTSKLIAQSSPKSVIQTTLKKDLPNYHKIGKQLKCRWCDYTTTDRTHMVCHVRTHTGEKPYKCPLLICGSSFSQQGSLKIHLRRHEALPFQCTRANCSFKFATQEHDPLENHVRLKHSELDKPYTCALCPKSYANLGRLTYHIKSHTGERTHPCSDCPQAFKNKSLLTAHVQSIHEKQMFPCQHCKKEFKSHKSLREHVNTCHSATGPKQLSLKCEGCGKMFISTKRLTQHLRSHIGEKPYVCNLCPYSTRWSGGLKSHVSRIHLKLIVASCPTCGKGFNTTKELKSHQLVHSGEKPFPCLYPQCGKKFSASSTLKSHQWVHTRERNFKCEFCFKTFTRRRSLTYHISTHTKEVQGNFECVPCNKLFATKQTLESHTSIHSNQRLFKCQICSRRFNYLILPSTFLSVHF